MLGFFRVVRVTKIIQFRTQIVWKSQKHHSSITTSVIHETLFLLVMERLTTHIDKLTDHRTFRSEIPNFLFPKAFIYEIYFDGLWANIWAHLITRKSIFKMSSISILLGHFPQYHLRPVDPQTGLNRLINPTISICPSIFQAQKHEGCYILMRLIILIKISQK